MFGYLGFMERVSVAEDSKHKYYFYQTTTRSCNITEIKDIAQIPPVT